jgi:hypothetical protein
MSHNRTSGAGIPFERCPQRGIVLVAGAILIGSAWGVPSASATLVGEAADTVGSTVESVNAAPSAAPSLPSATPPATPTPAASQVPVKLPTEATPSRSPTRSGVDVPSVDGIAGAASNPVGSATNTGKETTKQVTSSARNDGGRASTLQSGPDASASKATSRAIGTASSAPPSITAAEVAALRRWFARIWPAIPLDGGGADRGWAARAMEEDLFRPALAAIARSLFLVPPITRAAGDSPRVGHPGTANAPQLALPDGPDGEKIIYLAALAALLALLAFTIWREFRSALRPGVR